MIISGIILGCFAILFSILNISYHFIRRKKCGVLFDGMDITLSIVWAILPMALLYVVTLIPCAIMQSKHAEVETYISEERSIYSLETAQAVGGAFVLGAGTIDQKFVYVFYKTNEDGTYNLEYIDAEETTIMECDDCDPCIRKISYKVKNPDYWYKMGEELPTRYKEGTNVIIVPKGTVKQVYNGNIK